MSYTIAGHLITKSASSYGLWHIKLTPTTYESFWTLNAAKAWALANPI